MVKENIFIKDLGIVYPESRKLGDLEMLILK